MNDRLTWPADRFYWSIIESPAWEAHGQLPPGLLPLLEDACPEKAEDLHAVCHPLGEGQLLVCAARRVDLAAVSALSLTPTSLPPLTDHVLDPRSFELLAGEFEPASIQRLRTRRSALALTGVFAIALMVCVGLHRRAAALRDAASESRETDLALLRAARLERPTSDFLDGELANYEALARHLAGRSTRTAAKAFEEFLEFWPASAEGEPHSLRVEPERILTVIELADDAGPFLKDLRLAPGWVLKEPAINGARISLDFRRTGNTQ